MQKSTTIELLQSKLNVNIKLNRSDQYDSLNNSSKRLKTDNTTIVNSNILNENELSNDEYDFEKPPYSYVKLIVMAIRSSSRKQLRSSEILEFICNEFPYYEQAKENWQANVRSNLSHKEYFIKLGRYRGYWKIDPNFFEMFSDNLLNEGRRKIAVNDQTANIDNNNIVQSAHQSNIMLNKPEKQPLTSTQSRIKDMVSNECSVYSDDRSTNHVKDDFEKSNNNENNTILSVSSSCSIQKLLKGSTLNNLKLNLNNTGSNGAAAGYYVDKENIGPKRSSKKVQVYNSGSQENDGAKKSYKSLKRPFQEVQEHSHHQNHDHNNLNTDLIEYPQKEALGKNKNILLSDKAYGVSRYQERNWKDKTIYTMDLPKIEHPQKKIRNDSELLQLNPNTIKYWDEFFDKGVLDRDILWRL